MTDPSATTITQAVLDRLYASLHKTNDGPCDAVKLYGGELEALMEGKLISGFPAIWLYPGSSNEKARTDSIFDMEMTLIVFIAVANRYDEAGRLMGVGDQTGAIPLVDSVRELLAGQALASADPLEPSGFTFLASGTARDVPVSVFTYDWRVKFSYSRVDDESEYPATEKVRHKYHTPADAEDAILEGETELEES